MSPDGVTGALGRGTEMTQSICLCMVVGYHAFLLSSALPGFTALPGTALLQLQYPRESLTGQVQLLLSQLLLSHNFLPQPQSV